MKEVRLVDIGHVGNWKEHISPAKEGASVGKGHNLEHFWGLAWEREGVTLPGMEKAEKIML